MGTEGSITVYDENGKDLVNIVTHYDGYDLFAFVDRFLSGKAIRNGIGIGSYDFNGMGDLAARLVTALKTQRYSRGDDYEWPVEPGNVYLYSTPYQTDYHIDVRFQGMNEKPRMSVSQGDEWDDPFYDESVLPSIGKDNVKMKGSENFDAEVFTSQDGKRFKDGAVYGAGAFVGITGATLLLGLILQPFMPN